MARNIEIKARLAATGAASLEAVSARARPLADCGPEQLSQDDTFFVSADGGRLKLRVFGDGRAELIAYRRADAPGPKTSDYRIAAVAEPAALRGVLGHALGEAGRIVKERTLLRIGRTRVHLDRVAGLGDFLELEVVLAESEAEADGVAEAEALLQQLGVDSRQLVSGAYLDLLNPALAADRASAG